LLSAVLDFGFWIGLAILARDLRFQIFDFEFELRVSPPGSIVDKGQMGANPRYCAMPEPALKNGSIS
jgi:hypothetical protein